MIKIQFSDKFIENMERANSHGDYPCIICGCKCRNKNNMVYVDSGFANILTEEEFRQDADDMGLFPIGPDCLKKHPEVQQYIIK